MIVILSLALCDENEIDKFIEKVPEDKNLEINISCPNVHKNKLEDNLGKFVNDKREWCILKLSPTITEQQIDNYYNQGFRQFHCSNTLPVPVFYKTFWTKRWWIEWSKFDSLYDWN